MRPSTSLLVAAIALAATALAIRAYLQLKQKYPNPSQTIRETLKEMKGCDCEIEREGLPGPTDEDEEYRVLFGFLMESAKSSVNRGPLVVTGARIGLGRPRYEINPKCRQSEAWLDLAWKDMNCPGLEDRFNLGVPIVLLSREEDDEIFRFGRGWDTFYERYPGSDGLNYFSRVGFSRRGDIAVVRIGWVSGELSGCGATYILVRIRDGWKGRYSRQQWFS